MPLDEPWRALVTARNTLERIAGLIERLSPRQQRKLFRQTGLDADAVRSAAARCTDILALYEHPLADDHDF